jgi:hypothetical protein
MPTIAKRHVVCFKQTPDNSAFYRSDDPENDVSGIYVDKRIADELLRACELYKAALAAMASENPDAKVSLRNAEIIISAQNAGVHAIANAVA